MNSGQQSGWFLFNSFLGLGRDERRDLPQPQPDWTASFPVRAETSKCVPESSLRLPLDHQAANDPSAFPLMTLQRLASHGLAWNAYQLFLRPSQASNEGPRACFPWLVVEHGEIRSETTGMGDYADHAWGRAANAGNAAIMMLEHLAKGATESPHDIPPVITITTAGHLVKVWIMFLHEGASFRYVRNPSRVSFPANPGERE